MKNMKDVPMLQQEASLQHGSTHSQALLLDVVADTNIVLCRRAIFAPWPSMVTRALWASFPTKIQQGTLITVSMVKSTGSATAAKVAAALAPVLVLSRLARTGLNLPPVRPFFALLRAWVRAACKEARWSFCVQVHHVMVSQS